MKYAGPYDADLRVAMHGGPGTPDPAHLAWENVPMLRLLVVAYGVDFDQIDAPKWVDSELYTVLANIPAGATKDDLAKMFRRLLEERFHFAAHLVKREFPVYDLVVARNGPKLQASAGDPGKDRHRMSTLPENGGYVTRETFRDYSMLELTHELAWPLGGPKSWDHAVSLGRIVDKTGLAGTYDFELAYAGAHYPGGAFPPMAGDSQSSSAASLFDAVQQQLGLRIQEGKAFLDVVVVDHLERVPTGD